MSLAGSDGNWASWPFFHGLGEKGSYRRFDEDPTNRRRLHLKCFSAENLFLEICELKDLASKGDSGQSPLFPTSRNGSDVRMVFTVGHTDDSDDQGTLVRGSRRCD